MLFLGVASPSSSAAGIALAFLLYRMLVGQHQHLIPSERWLAMLGSLSCTCVGLLVLAALARHRETVEARIGVTYAIAAAATLLFLAMDPAAEAHHGEPPQGRYPGDYWPEPLSHGRSIRRCSMPTDGIS